MDKREEKGGINYSFPYMKEVNTNTWWENVQLAVYNPDERTFLGRTRKSWGEFQSFHSALSILNKYTKYAFGTILIKTMHVPTNEKFKFNIFENIYYFFLLECI